MKRKLVISLILTLILALVSTMLVNTSKGYVTDLPAIVKIHSPYENQVYSSTEITISVSVESPRKDYWEMISAKITVYLDNEIRFVRVTRQELSSEGRFFSYKSILNVGKGGLHSLYVIADIEYISHHPTWPVHDFTGSGKSDVVNFRVKIPSPMVKILSPEFQQTYNFSSVQLDFNISKPVSWIGYSLDGNDNVTVIGNTTLTGLSEGTHEIVVYATDEFGQTGKSHIRYFNIDTFLPSAPASPDAPTTFPTSLVVAVLVLVSVVTISIGLLFYFKKRKR